MSAICAAAVALGLLRAAAAQAGVVINELMYNSPLGAEAEYIELLNIDSKTVEVSCGKKKKKKKKKNLFR
jgi:hypothetical protein